MKKPREEIAADGSKWVGEGPTYIVFAKSGDVYLKREGESAEQRALIKNLSPEVTSGGVTLMINDFLFEDERGVPVYSQSLATFFRSVILDTKSEKEADGILKKLRSVVLAARRLAHEPVGKTAHEQFRRIVMYLAKRSSRVPTQSEIRHAMFPKADPISFNRHTSEISRLCRANGLSWLPTDKSGRPKKKKDSKAYKKMAR